MFVHKKMRIVASGLTAIGVSVIALVAVMTWGSSSTAAESAGTSVAATEKDFSISVSPSSAAPGEVHFTVTNQGTTGHEFVIIKTDNPPDALPYDTAKQQAVEDGSGDEDVGEIEDIDHGQTKSDTFNLAAGKYVLVCNLPGHYKLGMFTAFTVSPAPSAAPAPTTAPAAAAPAQPQAAAPAKTTLPSTGSGPAGQDAVWPEILGSVGGVLLALGLGLFWVARPRRSAL